MTLPSDPRVSAAPGVALTHTDEAEHRLLLAQAVNKLFDGKVNSIGQVTLAASTTTTTINDRRIGLDTAVILIPTTQNTPG